MDLLKSNKDIEEIKVNIRIKSKNNGNMNENTKPDNKNLEIEVDGYNKLLSSNDIDEALSPTTKKEPKSKRFYNKFVNGIKKSGQGNIYDENGDQKFITIVNKMMDQILIKNNVIRHSIKSPNAKKNAYKRLCTFNKTAKKDDNLKSRLLIQKVFKHYINKKHLYDEIINEEHEYLTLNEMKNKDKEDLEIFLLKYISLIKLLFEIINYYKKKCKYIEFDFKKKKFFFKKEKQNDINILSIKNNHVKAEQNHEEKGKEKENKAILKSSKRINHHKPSNKRVTIIDIKGKDPLLSHRNENNNNHLKVVNTDKNNNNNENNNNITNYQIINNKDNSIDENNNKKENENKNNNIKEKKENIENNKVDENPETKRERLKKSRGLRKILTKKVKEKKEILRTYFRKFYLGGLYISIRKGVRNRTQDIKRALLEKKRVRSVEHKRISTCELLLNKNLFNFSVGEEEYMENEENIKKRNQLLTKIIYRKDRVHTLVLKTAFQKLNLRVKLVSLNAAKKLRATQSKKTVKGKRKKTLKSQSVDAATNKFINKDLENIDKKKI